jgi:hypothetical protein
MRAACNDLPAKAPAYVLGEDVLMISYYRNSQTGYTILWDSCSIPDYVSVKGGMIAEYLPVPGARGVDKLIEDARRDLAAQDTVAVQNELLCNPVVAEWMSDHRTFALGKYFTGASRMPAGQCGQGSHGNP